MSNTERYTIKDSPQDFQYKPAHGKVNEDGSVTVSGVNMTQDEIDEYGASYRELDEVFQEIEAKLQKEDEGSST